MNFSLSNEQLMAQKMVRDFAQKEVAPVIKEYDRKQEAIPLVLKRRDELGILGICFPVKYGGQGMKYISLGEWKGSPLRCKMPAYDENEWQR